MDYSILLFTIFKLAVLLGMGMWIAYKVALTKDIRSFLILVIINIALPAIILNGFFQVKITDSLIKQMMIIFLFSISFIVIGLIIGWLFSKLIGLKPLKARETAFLSTFGNTGLIGIPLCASLFGAKGAVFAAVFDAGMSLMLWTVGILFIQGTSKVTLKSLKSMLSAPNIAVLIGLILTLLKWDPHFFIKDTASTISGIASPLAMFYIGMLVMTIIKEKRRVSAKLVSIPVSFKLLILPLVGILVLLFLPLSRDVEQILLIELAMPSVTTASVIFALHRADEDYAVMHTLFTNLLCLITIPIIVVLGGMFL